MTHFLSIKAFTIGAIIALLAGSAYQSNDIHHLFNAHLSDHAHATKDVHFHADLAIFINDTQLDLSADTYMSGLNQLLSESVHLHDNNDKVIHFHDTGITIPVFLDSLGITLTEQCLTLATDEAYCTNNDDVLTVLINGEPVTDVHTFLPADEDQVLIHYGPVGTDVSQHTTKVTSDACIYSLTCPEKGTPPPESCGLTCEL